MTENRENRVSLRDELIHASSPSSTSSTIVSQSNPNDLEMIDNDNTEKAISSSSSSSSHDTSSRYEIVTDSDDDYNCPECNRRNTDEMIECENCSDWIHLDCIPMNLEIASRIKYYICDSCSIKNSKLMSSWKLRKPSVEQAIDKRDHYHEVEKILSHRSVMRGRRVFRSFQIKWVGYEKTDWEPEWHLDGCLDTLQDYLRKEGLEYSHIKGIVGATNSKEKCLTYTLENWVPMERILEKFQQMKDKYFPKSTINAVIGHDIGSKDMIHFIQYQSHCIVLLYDHNKNIAHISDGNNLYLNDIEFCRDIKALLRIRIRACSYDQQTKIDHCGSSAVLIALEFVRHFEKKSRPQQLVSPSSWVKLIKEQFHHFESMTLPLDSVNLRRNQLICSVCKKSFRADQRRGYFNHIRIHN